MAQSTAAQFDAAIKETIQATQRTIVAAAKEAHSEIMGKDPKPLSFVRHVDGQLAPEEAVKPGGVIVYDYNRLDAVVSGALDILRQRSPILSGDYVRGHTLCLNGNPVDDLKSWKPGDEVSITNTVPYSRKIESGHMRMSVPPHVYENALPIIRSRFDNYATFSFAMRPHPGGEILKGQFRAGFRPQARRKLQKDTQRGASLTYPTLIIRERS